MAVAGLGDRRRPRRSPRGVMTVGSIAGVVLVLVWSQVHGLVGFYVLWAGKGAVMATVLYEPASRCWPSGSRSRGNDGAR